MIDNMRGTAVVGALWPIDGSWVAPGLLVARPRTSAFSTLDPKQRPSAPWRRRP